MVSLMIAGKPPVVVVELLANPGGDLDVGGAGLFCCLDLLLLFDVLIAGIAFVKLKGGGGLEGELVEGVELFIRLRLAALASVVSFNFVLEDAVDHGFLNGKVGRIGGGVTYVLLVLGCGSPPNINVVKLLAEDVLATGVPSVVG